MLRGALRNIVNQKNFGFIRYSGVDYFFHRDDFDGHWGDLVNMFQNTRTKIELDFEVAESNKGPRATRVHRAN